MVIKKEPCGCAAGFFFAFYLQQGEADDQAGEHDGDRGAQLDEDVQGRAGGILEGIAHGVADDGRLVLVGALAAVVAGLNVLLVESIIIQENQ